MVFLPGRAKVSSEMESNNAMAGQTSFNGEQQSPVANDLRDTRSSADDAGAVRPRAHRATKKRRRKEEQPHTSVVDCREDAAFDTFREAVTLLKMPYGDPDDPAWHTHKQVMDVLCRREYDGIASRDPGSLEIRCTEKGFSVSVSDFGLGTKVTVYCTRLLDCLNALQEGFDRKRPVLVGRLKRGKGADKLKAEERKALEARAMKR